MERTAKTVDPRLTAIGLLSLSALLVSLFGVIAFRITHDDAARRSLPSAPQAVIDPLHKLDFPALASAPVDDAPAKLQPRLSVTAPRDAFDGTSIQTQFSDLNESLAPGHVSVAVDSQSDESSLQPLQKPRFIAPSSHASP